MSVEADKKNDTSLPFGDLTPHDLTCPSFSKVVSGPTTYVECKPVSKMSYSHSQLDSGTYTDLTTLGPV